MGQIPTSVTIVVRSIDHRSVGATGAKDVTVQCGTQRVDRAQNAATSWSKRRHHPRETGIAAPTLYAWKKQLRERGFVVPKTPASADRRDARTKLAAVINTAVMNEAERSDYCREVGAYAQRLDAWKAAFETMDAGAGSAGKAELAQARKQNRQLAKELLRKERALTEAAALLTLSKKAQAIWGTDADD